MEIRRQQKEPDSGPKINGKGNGRKQTYHLLSTMIERLQRRRRSCMDSPTGASTFNLLHSICQVGFASPDAARCKTVRLSTSVSYSLPPTSTLLSHEASCCEGALPECLSLRSFGPTHEMIAKTIEVTEFLVRLRRMLLYHRSSDTKQITILDGDCRLICCRKTCVMLRSRAERRRAHDGSLLMGEKARGAFCEAVAEHDHIGLWLTA